MLNQQIRTLLTDTHLLRILQHRQANDMASRDINPTINKKLDQLIVLRLYRQT